MKGKKLSKENELIKNNDFCYNIYSYIQKENLMKSESVFVKWSFSL